MLPKRKYAFISAKNRSHDHNHHTMTLGAGLAKLASAGTADRAAQLVARLAIATAALNGTLARIFVRNKSYSLMIDYLMCNIGSFEVPFLCYIDSFCR